MWHIAAVVLALVAPAEEHRVVAEPGSVQCGYHEASVPPALAIRSGDTVVVETLVTGAHLLRTFGVPEHYIRDEMEVPYHIITMGPDPAWDAAAKLAVNGMIEYLVEEKGFTADDAHVLCSAAVDLRVTQLVDGTKGVHAMLSKGVFVEGGES